MTIVIKEITNTGINGLHIINKKKIKKLKRAQSL